MRREKLAVNVSPLQEVANFKDWRLQIYTKHYFGITFSDKNQAKQFLVTAVSGSAATRNWATFSVLLFCFFLVFATKIFKLTLVNFQYSVTTFSATTFLRHFGFFAIKFSIFCRNIFCVIFGFRYKISKFIFFKLWLKAFKNI